jgi:hypothetical protein
MRRAMLLLLVPAMLHQVGCASPARAGGTLPPGSAWPAPPPRASSSPPGEKDPKTALVISGIGTGASAALVLASVVVVADSGTVHRPTFFVGVGTSLVTPSLGHWYAGEWLTVGMGVRAGAALLAVLGATQTRDDRCDVDPTEICPTLTNAGFTLLGLAGIAYVAGVAYDVVDAPDAVERHARTRLPPDPFSMRLVPTTSTHGAGLAVLGRW